MTIRELADDPVSYDKDGLQGIVADAVDGRLNTLNTDTTSAADLEKELTDVVEEAVTEVGKLARAQKRFDDAVAAEADADGAEAQRAAQKEMRAAKTALDAAKAEYDIKEAEILAKLLDILTRAGLLGGGTGSPLDYDDRWRDDQDPTKPKPSSDKPGDSPGDSPGDKPGDNPSSDDPSSPGKTQLSSDTNPTQQQQPQQQQAQQPQQSSPQPQQGGSMSPSAGMQQQPNVSPSAFNVRPRDRDKPKNKDEDRDSDALPVPAAVPAAVPIDRGTSVNGGTTTRDISGKPTALSTAGQVPGSAAGQNPRGGMGGSGGMVGGAPIGGGNKADTSAKRSSKRFDIESLFKPDDDNDQSVNSGALSKDSLAATEKAREDERNRMQEAMRESVKRMMTDKKAG